MPKKGITGHDEWVVTEALATAFVALEQLPEKHQPRAHMDDIKKLLAAGCQPAPPRCIWPRQNAGYSPAPIRWRSIGNTASRMARAERRYLATNASIALLPAAGGTTSALPLRTAVIPIAPCVLARSSTASTSPAPPRSGNPVIGTSG